MEQGATQEHPTREIYNHLVVMQHLMQRINPGSGWRTRLMEHIATATPDQQQAMGFPDGWHERMPWRMEA